jgi:hypothetical protein
LHGFADSGRTKDDVVVFYYTGHGVVEDDHFLFVPTNADPEHLDREGIRAVDLARWLFDCPRIGHLMIILDTCHAGHGVTQVAVEALRMMSREATNSDTGPASVVLMTATRPKEQAESGAFTQAFEKAVAELEAASVDRSYLEIADLVARVDRLTPGWQGARHHVIGGERPAPFLPTNHGTRPTVQDTLNRLKERQDQFDERLDRVEGHRELLALMEAMRSDDSGGVGPLSPDDRTTLVQALTSALGIHSGRRGSWGYE